MPAARIRCDRVGLFSVAGLWGVGVVARERGVPLFEVPIHDEVLSADVAGEDSDKQQRNHGDRAEAIRAPGEAFRCHRFLQMLR